MLQAIFTTYPRFKLRHESLPQSKIHCRWHWHAPLLALWRYGGRLGPLEKSWLRETVKDFESWLTRRVPECDVFIALSGSGLAAGRKVQGRGGRYICDRGSSHIRWGENLLREEFLRWAEPFEGTDPLFICKEESEYAEADLITVPSSFAARSFEEQGVPKEKVRVVPYGVDFTRFAPQGMPPSDEFRVLFVGQVSFRKGLPYLLEAFERLARSRKRLTIIGALRPEMKRWLSGRSFPQVEFLGALPQAQLPRYLSTSHVHVLASIEEGMAYVQAQAMACGCPLISTCNTGACDLITDGQEGFIVPIRDPAAITARLQQLADDPGLQQRMRAASLRRVQTIGGWDSYGEALARVITEVRKSSVDGGTVKTPLKMKA